MSIISMNQTVDLGPLATLVSLQRLKTLIIYLGYRSAFM
jgi:hypothetical protein